MSEPVELTVHELEPVALTTSVVVPAPAPGWSLELDRTDTHIRVRQVRGDDAGDWQDVVPLSLLQGKDGSTPFLRATATHLEWSPDESEWFELVALETLKGQSGDDAYEIAVSLGYEGDREQWLESLNGSPGLSAFQLAVLHGFEGTVEQWLVSLQGQPGASAYKVAQDAGFVGSQAQWLASLKGDAGLSAYAVAVQNGFVGTPVAWLNSLKGDPGADGWSVEVQKSATHIQTRRVRGTETTTWANLVALSEITGQQGNPGAQGASGMPNTDLVGTGMPNGVVTGSPGAIYRDTAGTNGAWLWIKKAGVATTTGWHVINGNTGVRRLTLPTGWNGRLEVQRANDVVTLSGTDLWLQTGVATTTGPERPVGFRPAADRGAMEIYTARAVTPLTRGIVFFGGRFDWAGAMTAAADFNGGFIQYTTSDPWPVGALPGVPG